MGALFLIMKKKIVILTGAGISAESGLKTFRDMGGLWENYAIEDVASPEGWERNPELVLDFYNQRRKQAFAALPNAGHLALVKLEEFFEVKIITQNVDGLHEKAGSSFVIHLHGELSKVRSVRNEELVRDIGSAFIQLGDLAEDGAQLRPHIVWFGEQVPMIEVAAESCQEADIFLVIGTSLQVYPAAGLLSYVPSGVSVYVIDPSTPSYSFSNTDVRFVQKTAVEGVPVVVEELINTYKK